MLKTLFAFLVCLVFWAGAHAQDLPDNRTPEKKHEDSIEAAQFRKKYPEALSFNQRALLDSDGSWFVGGHSGPCLLIRENTVVDSVHNNFNLDTTLSVDKRPFTEVRVGGPRVSVCLFYGLLMNLRGYGMGVIRELPNDSLIDDWNKMMERHKIRPPAYIPDFFYVRVSLNGKLLTDWTPLDSFPRTPCYVGQHITLDSTRPAMNVYQYTYEYHVCDTTLKVNDQLFIDVKESKHNWRVNGFNITRVQTTPVVTSMLSQPTEGATLGRTLSSPPDTLRPTISTMLRSFIVPARETSISFGVLQRSDAEYSLSDLDAPDTNWRPIPMDPAAFWLSVRAGHSYDLALRYRFQRESVNHYLVVARPHWWNTLVFQLASGFLTGFIVVMALFRTYQLRKRRQLSQSLQSLQSVQAQLNPHFIFNALTSIQGLINTGDIHGANQYLSEFAVLMRNTLSNQSQQFVRLGLELSAMETYLRLEQLRFHFDYSVRVDPGLSPDDEEIPHLLLQPVIENAVRHGVASMGQGGCIRIGVFAHAADLHIDIRDNGPGMPAAPLGAGAGGPESGYGLKLVRDRLDLLNRVLRGRSIELQQGEGPGAVFIFIFKNWLG